MARYILQRTLTIVGVAWVIVTLTFFMMKALPGGPFSSDKKVPDSIMRNIERKYKLDQPLWRQYTDYVRGVIVWELGPSFRYEGLTVNDVINKGFPISAALGGASVLLSLGIGIPMGVLSALRHNSALDRTTQALAVLTAAAPSFVVAAVLQYVIGYKLRWVPPGGWGTTQQMILPILALTAYTLAWVVKLTRSTALEVVSQDYMRTARAKGLPTVTIIYRHLLRNALVPVVTSVAPLAASLLVGSFVVELMFAIPGVGREFVTSIGNRDYTVTLGMTLFLGFLLMGFTLLGDVATALIDPRIRLEKEG